MYAVYFTNRIFLAKYPYKGYTEGFSQFEKQALKKYEMFFDILSELFFARTKFRELCRF